MRCARKRNGVPSAVNPRYHGGMSSATPQKKSMSGAFLVGAGIFLSRIAGLVRERVFAHYFGNSDASDAFKAALKIPNFLQNLFGEGVLSASFIPVYAGLLANELEEEAARVASVIGSLLFVVTSFLVLLGVLATPVLIDLIAPGFEGEKRQLTIELVQIFFPGTGFLVMSAWCLGILNSHRRFFLSYVAPVIWNVTIIAFLIQGGPRLNQSELALWTAWGLLAGSFLQFAVQLPLALRLGKKLRPRIETKLASVRVVLKNFVPVVFSRGVVQVSAYIDNVLASLLPTGAVSSLAYAQTLYLLPVSLFGMSLSASELPEMSRARGTDSEIKEYLKKRLAQALEKIHFFIVPSAMAFLVLGDLVVGAVFQTGEFDRSTTLTVWAVLAGSTVGMLASTQGRLYSSCFYSLKDARKPLNFALLRVLLTTALGWIGAFYVPAWLGLSENWGTVGLTFSWGMAAWIECILLKNSLGHRIGSVGISATYRGKLWFAAFVSAGAAFALNQSLPPMTVILKALICLSVYGLGYFIICGLLRVALAKQIVGKVFSRVIRR